MPLMVKVLAYEEQGRGTLDRFWDNPGNFRDADLPEARDLYAEIRALRGGAD